MVVGLGIPSAVREEVEAALEAHTGASATLVSARPVSGGSINSAARVETAGGGGWFLKWNASGTGAMFRAEADGLAALASGVRETGAELRVPEMVAVGDGGPGPSWLLLEFVERGPGSGSGDVHAGPGRASEDEGFGPRLGRGLAALHEPGGDIGWHRDNFIGSLPQANGLDSSKRGAPGERENGAPGGLEELGTRARARKGARRTGARSFWPRFWAEARLLPQLRAARERGHLAGRRGRTLDALLERTPGLLEGALDEGPALLHGDLWGGNVFPAWDGRPVLVDPAVYRGHREVDLAMSELFGFPGGFLPAYREARPVDAAYDAFRRDLYQLFYLLVHVNLFGAGYEAGCLRAAERVLAAT